MGNNLLFKSENGVLHLLQRLGRGQRKNNGTMLKKKNIAAGYQGPVKIELLKGAGQLENLE